MLASPLSIWNISLDYPLRKCYSYPRWRAGIKSYPSPTQQKDLSMSGNFVPTYSHQRLTASGVAKPGPGVLGSIFCSSSTSGFAQVLDDTTNTGTHIVINTFPLVAGTNYQFNREFARGIYVVITGTADISVGYY